MPSADDVKPAGAAPAAKKGKVESYSVAVDGQLFNVQVGPEGSISGITPASSAPAPAAPAAPAAVSDVEGEDLPAPLAGNIFKVLVNEGEQVSEGDVLLVMEAMKMETEIRATRSGAVLAVQVKEGDSVAVGEALFVIG